MFKSHHFFSQHKLQHAKSMSFSLLIWICLWGPKKANPVSEENAGMILPTRKPASNESPPESPTLHCTPKYHAVHINMPPPNRQACFRLCSANLKHAYASKPWHSETGKQRRRKERLTLWMSVCLSLVFSPAHLQPPPLPHPTPQVFHAQSRKCGRMQPYRTSARSTIWENKDLQIHSSRILWPFKGASTPQRKWK